jgi:chromosome segregation ATPase
MSQDKSPADLLTETQHALKEFLATSRELSELRRRHCSLADEQQEALGKLSALETSVAQALEQTRDLGEKTQERCQAMADRVELARLQFADQVREVKAETRLEIEKQEEKIHRLGGDLAQLGQALGKLLKKQRELDTKLNWLLVVVAGLAGVLTLALVILRP